MKLSLWNAVMNSTNEQASRSFEKQACEKKNNYFTQLILLENYYVRIEN